jgi:hypothetical protein
MQICEKILDHLDQAEQERAKERKAEVDEKLALLCEARKVYQ